LRPAAPAGKSKEGSNIRLVIDQFFRELDLVPNVVMEAEDTEAIKRLVESGFGYSILPEHAVRGRTFSTRCV